MSGHSHERRLATLELRSGWSLILACAIGYGVGLVLYGFIGSVFVEGLQREFGWSRAAISASMFGFAVAGLILPVTGILIDRFGSARIALCSYLLLAAGYGSITLIPGNIFVFYAVIGLTMIAGSGTGPIAFSRIIAANFRSARGFALSLALAGSTVVGAIGGPLASALIAEWGWRAGFLMLSGAALFIGVPLCLFALNGAHAPATRAGEPDPNLAGPSLPEALRQRRLWLLFGCIFFTGFPVMGLASQIQPLLIDKGFDLQTAAFGISALSVSMFSGRVITGWAIDRFWAPGVAVVVVLLAASGALILSMPTGHSWLVILGIALLGGVKGAELDLLGYLVARYFGMRNFASIYAFVYFAVALAIPLGAVAFGTSFDLFGSYDATLWLACGTLSFAAVLYTWLGAYPTEQAGTPLRAAGH